MKAEKALKDPTIRLLAMMNNRKVFPITEKYRGVGVLWMIARAQAHGTWKNPMIRKPV